MKILLVTTPLNPLAFDRSSIALMEPLNLEYIGAGVQDHHDVRLVDLRVDTEPRLREVLESFQPDVIGCGAYTSEVNPTKQLCAEAKKILPGVLTVVGSVHATVRPQDFFEDTIDVVVVGEGVFPFKKICEYHEKQKSFEDIENIYFRKKGGNGHMVFTQKAEMPPLDTLPLPARKLTSHVRHKYGNFVLKTVSLAMARSSLGCTFNCKFCSVSGMLNRRMYFHSVERILEDLHAIEEPMIFWTDDELLLNNQHAHLLAKEIQKAGIKKDHFFFGRVDSIVRHPETIAEWAKSGLHSIVIGFESHRESDLEKMRKTTGLSKNEECIRICRDHDVKVRGNFIVMPDYSKEDFKDLARYTLHLGLDVSTYCVWTPLPGTDLWEEHKNELITHDYNYFDMVHVVLPTKLPLKKFYKELSNLMFNRSYPLKKKLKVFKQIEPKMRRKVFSHAMKMHRELKNSYRHHDKRLW